MTNPKRTILITGGAGFIGSHLIRWLLENSPHRLINLDRLTYASNLAALSDCDGSDRYEFEEVDIRDMHLVQKVFQRHQPDCVMHLAAETHVDRSIHDPMVFAESNIMGTFNLLEASREMLKRSQVKHRADFRFIQVSTDEVFGSLDHADPACVEQTAYAPRSPYSATKAAADHLTHAWGVTFGLPVITTRCSNNYGPWQYPEKLIPVVIHSARIGQSIPVYGNGENIRDWIHVLDHVRALVSVMDRGQVGSSYNISGNCELSNNELISRICKVMDELLGKPAGAHEKLIEFVADRPGHDFRYAMDSRRILRELGWQPQIDLANGLQETVAWYLNSDNRFANPPN